MGLTLPFIRLLLREHARKPFCGRVLTLGRQFVHATREQVLEAMRLRGLEASPVDARAGSNIASWRGTGRQDNLSDVHLFKMLGADQVMASDISDYEGAEILLDLGQPLSENHVPLLGSFDLILDGGTMEHVFDAAQGFRNICSLLRPGGRVIHLSPSSNFMDHGFYSFSPTFFFHYYLANHFIDPHCWLVEHDSGPEGQRAWLYEYDPSRPVPYGGVPSSLMWLTFFVSEKTAHSTGMVAPVQGRLGGSGSERLPMDASLSGTRLDRLREGVRAFELAHIVQRPWLASLWRRFFAGLQSVKRGSRYPLKSRGRL